MNSKTKFKYIDNISLSGYKLVRLFILLSQSSCTESEINKMYLDDELVLKAQSRDTIKSYINILRSLGCEISRPSKSNDYKYVISNCNFKPNFKEDLIEELIKIKKNLSSINDWKFLISLTTLYKKIDDFFLSDNQKGGLSLDITTLSSLNLKIVNQLEKHCNSKRGITILYKSPNSGDKKIEILPEYLFFENNYLYIWGQDPLTKSDFYLRVDRIKSIEIIKINRSYKEKKIAQKARYRLKNDAMLAFRESENRKIISKTQYYIEVEANIFSDFYFMQEILGYGLDCEIIEPENIRHQVAEKIKSVLRTYEEKTCK